MDVTVAIVTGDEAARLAIVKALDAAPPGWAIGLHREPPRHADVIVSDRQIEGALVFDPEKSDLVSAIAERLRDRARTIFVCSPSGGTGVTTISLHLAAGFVPRGHPTALVDLDPYRGARARLGLDPEIVPDAPVPVAGGFRLVDSTTRAEGFDRVVVDAGTAIERMTDVHAAVLVSSPSPQGARRCLAPLEERPGIQWHVVTNRLGPGGETTRSQFERLVGRPVLELPCCAALRDTEDEGRLLRRHWTRWSRSMDALVDALGG